eukprot:1389712-Amphidinium_carterae.1
MEHPYGKYSMLKAKKLAVPYGAGLRPVVRSSSCDHQGLSFIQRPYVGCVPMDGQRVLTFPLRKRHVSNPNPNLAPNPNDN